MTASVRERPRCWLRKLVRTIRYASATTPAGSAPRAALLERGLDSTNGLGFVRERLALVSKTLFLVSLGFYLFLLASLTLIGGAPFVGVVRGPVALGSMLVAVAVLTPLYDLTNAIG